MAARATKPSSSTSENSSLSSLYTPTVFHPFQGKAQHSSFMGTDDTTPPNTIAERKWKNVNGGLWSVLILTTSGSENKAAKKIEGKRVKDEAGNRQAALNTRTKKYNSHIQETRRACHEKLVNTLRNLVRVPKSPPPRLGRMPRTRCRHWGVPHTTSGTRTSSSKLFLPSTLECEPLALRSSILGLTILDTWYTPCALTIFPVSPTTSQSQSRHHLAGV